MKKLNYLILHNETFGYEREFMINGERGVLPLVYPDDHQVDIFTHDLSDQGWERLKEKQQSWMDMFKHTSKAAPAMSCMLHLADIAYEHQLWADLPIKQPTFTGFHGRLSIRTQGGCHLALTLETADLLWRLLVMPLVRNRASAYKEARDGILPLLTYLQKKSLNIKTAPQLDYYFPLLESLFSHLNSSIDRKLLIKERIAEKEDFEEMVKLAARCLRDNSELSHISVSLPCDYCGKVVHSNLLHKSRQRYCTACRARHRKAQDIVKECKRDGNLMV